MRPDVPIYKLAEDIVIRKADSKALVLATGSVVELNAPALFLLEELRRPLSLKDLTSLVLSSCTIEETTTPAIIEAWVQDFLTDGVASGLVEEQ